MDATLVSKFMKELSYSHRRSYDIHGPSVHRLFIMQFQTNRKLEYPTGFRFFKFQRYVCTLTHSLRASDSGN